jgi:formate hydrogenlyase subunit 4
MMEEWLEIIIKLGIGFAALWVVIFLSLLLKGVDRKFAAWLQARVGPPIWQPFWDVAKLWQKENVIPERAVPWVFNGAPVLALISSMLLFFYIPVGPVEGLLEDWMPLLGGYGDLILIVYLLAVPGLMMAIGGFASGSPLSTVGAQREMVMMMSYELPLAIVILAIAWRITQLDGSLVAFDLGILSNPDYTLWSLEGIGALGIVGAILLAVVFFLIIPSELSKIPFDAPEAETEIGGGIIAEYSGNNLAMFYLADAIKTVAFTSLAIALFFPYNFSPVVESVFDTALSDPAAWAIDIAFWLIKIEVLYFVAVTVVRVGAARLKIDRLSWLYLIPLSILGVIGVILLYLDTLV